MSLLGVDVGTTHCKAVICDEDGSPQGVARETTPLARDAGGLPYHNPETLWLSVIAVIRAVGALCDLGAVRALGVTSMAEAGLLIDTRSGEPRTEIIPWYDTRTSEQANFIAGTQEPLELFRRSGLHPSFKYGLEKILWLRTRDRDVVDGAVWLSVADYIVFRLTGCMVTDPTLAARTYVYAVSDGAWDDAWIRHFGLVPANFPPVRPTGEPVGGVCREAATRTGLAAGIPASIAGHDHICASLAVGLASPGTVVDSIGTAESMLGVLEQLELTQEGFDSGLVMGPHVLPNLYCWLGGTRSSGGSIAWIQGILSGQQLAHDDWQRLLGGAGADPTNLFYFPYLVGSGGIRPNDRVRGAFIGLDASHGTAHLFKAVLEGTAYESEAIRRAAETLTGDRLDEMIVVGGGARNQAWVQIRADVTGCRCVLPEIDEATALGAALLAGLGSRIIGSPAELASITSRYTVDASTIHPDEGRRQIYQRSYDTGYEPIGLALRAVMAGVRRWSENDG